MTDEFLDVPVIKFHVLYNAACLLWVALLFLVILLTSHINLRGSPNFPVRRLPALNFRFLAGNHLLQGRPDVYRAWMTVNEGLVAIFPLGAKE